MAFDPNLNASAAKDGGMAGIDQVQRGGHKIGAKVPTKQNLAKKARTSHDTVDK